MSIPHANAILRFDDILPAMFADPCFDDIELDMEDQPDFWDEVYEMEDALDFACVSWSNAIDAELSEAAWAEDLADSGAFEA